MFQTGLQISWRNTCLWFPHIHTLKHTIVYTEKYIHIYTPYTHINSHILTHTLTDILSHQQSHPLTQTHTYVLTQTYTHSNRYKPTHIYTPHAHTHLHTQHPPTHSFSHRVFLVGQVYYATQNMINPDDCSLSWSLYGTNSLHNYYTLECVISMCETQINFKTSNNLVRG
jgi:hypothetical protein